jgi:cytidylate kinase
MNNKTEVEDFIKEQIVKWRNYKGEHIPVITIAHEPGSGGRQIAFELAKACGFNLYDSILMDAIAASADVSTQVVESVEKARLDGIQEFIAMLVEEHHLSPSDYLKYLMSVLMVIADHGHAVIVGRGGNFIIPPEKRLSVFTIAPLEQRVENVAAMHNVSAKEARRRIVQREGTRAAFIKQSFNADWYSPKHYDLVINTEHLTIERAVKTILGAFGEMTQQ